MTSKKKFNSIGNCEKITFYNFNIPFLMCRDRYFLDYLLEIY